MKHIEPSEGLITLGGISIKKVPHSYYYSHFGYVSKDSHSFKTSIYENITMNDPDISPEEVKMIVRDLQLESFINTLPKGLYTVLDKRKFCFSQGQIQRIILARALIKKPNILLLDDFSSSTDKEIEENIFKTLFERFKEQTIIAITNDRSIINLFEKVIFLKRTIDKDEELSLKANGSNVTYIGMINEQKR